MRKLCGFVLPSLVIILAALASWRLTVSRSDETIPGAGPRAQFAPYYTLTQGFRAMLMLNNSTGAAFVVKPTVYSLKGRTAETQPIHLSAHETKQIDIGQWVAGLGDEYRSGSLRLDYESAEFGLGAMVMMINEQDSLELDVLARPQGAFKSSRLEAIWWAPRRRAHFKFAVQNTTGALVTGTLLLTDSRAREVKTIALELAPHQTQLFKVDELANREDISLGGISIRHDGRPGSLMAQAFVVQRDVGFSANLPFEDPATFRDSKLEGAGVLIGSDINSSLTRYTGHLLLRNTSSSPLTARPVLQRGIFTDPLAGVTLQPGEAREITVPDNSLADSAEAAGIEITHGGLPGDLLGYWFSVNPTGDLLVETPLRSPEPSEPGGGNNPWTIADDFSSVMYVKNTGSEKAAFLAKIWYAEGEYTIGLKEVAPGETGKIDIRKLRDDKVPDVNGRTLPANAVNGQILWSWRVGSPLVGRLNTMSLSRRLARNMSCNTCCPCPESVSLELRPAPFAGPVGGSVQLVPWRTDRSCTGTSVYPVAADPWSSTDSTVAPVSPSGLVTCQFPGSATISAQHNYSYYETDTSVVPPQGGGCFCILLAAAIVALDNGSVTPTVTTNCTPQHLALGPTAPASTINGSCNTTASPAGGTFSWSANTNTVTLSSTSGSAIGYTSANPSSSQGDTTIAVTYTVNGQSATAQSQPITVHKPTSLAVLSDTTNPTGTSCNPFCLANPGDGTCSATAQHCPYSSYLRTRVYSTVDQFGNQFANIGLFDVRAEESLPTTSNCPNLTFVPLRTVFTANFSDDFSLCHTCCLSGGPGCSASTNPVQTITVNGIVVRQVTVNWTCTGASLSP